MPGPGQPTELFGHPSKVVQDAWAIVQRLEEDRGLHQIVNVADHVTHGHDLSRLVARCLISSSYVVLKMPGMIYRQQGPDEHLAGLKDGWDTSAQQTKLEQMVLSERLHENDFCVVLPASTQTTAPTRPLLFQKCDFADSDVLLLELRTDHVETASV